jgi:uncharacterized membrane protein YeaQ/YmgE (transglycosylase-associated protein family)
MMTWIVTLLIGLVVGAVARFLLPGDQKMGLILTSLLGVAGSFIARFAGEALGWYAPGQPAGWIASVVAAVVLLFVVQKLKGTPSDNAGS